MTPEIATEFDRATSGLYVPTTETEGGMDTAYLPANHDLPTIPDGHGLPPVTPRTEHSEPSTVDTPATSGGVGPINQHQQDSEPDAATGPLQRLVTRRRRGRSATEAERAEITDPKVIRRKAAARCSGELERAATDPDAQAHADRKARLRLLGMSGLGIALGVAISSATAQDTITSFMGWADGTVAATAAYGADPALGLVLFAILALRALASTRGVVLPAGTQTAFNRIEFGLFSLVATLNIGPSLGHLAAALLGSNWAEVGPAVMVLVIHALGPVLVAAGVYGIPHMLAVFDLIRTATATTTGGGVGPINREKQPPDWLDAKWHDEFHTLIRAIDSGELEPDPTGRRLYGYLGGGDAAKKGPLRDAVAGHHPAT